ncbi:pancreatic triacylglycerol lipase-like [Physella acuta]|uniref:pancreatic triacylglycerol lipase-like n=1 Tax=Physella acuta TaxID=109671 RepID=UPI0027DD43A1|nr:pancreatic triacylglycerol lipase-like [Physella acuta]
MRFFLIVVFCLHGQCMVDSLSDRHKRAAVCYDEFGLGCFPTGKPFGSTEQRLISLPPQSPDVVRTIFKLYTREKRNNSIDLDARLVNTTATTWPGLKRQATKFIVHGFLENTAKHRWLRDMKDEFLQYADYNVIIVDWSNGNGFPYTQATANSRVVGAQIALLINWLIKTQSFTAGDFHVIGHSLGAHIAGYAGERVVGLARISGLDPAGPYFADTDPRVRLDPSDAKFVDVIHTDDTKLVGLGMSQPSGHLDFYPNGGHDQRGCDQNIVLRLLYLLKGQNDDFGCSHVRARLYYIESINSNCSFTSFPCSSEADFNAGKCTSCGSAGCYSMGYHADQMTSGQHTTLYLTTASQPPFCLF